MNNSLRKNLVFLILFLFSFIWISTAFASNYPINITFSHELRSITRYFDGQNIAFEATPFTYPEPKYPNAQPTDTIYKATLIRDNGWGGKEKIGSAILPRNSFGKAIWTNVGPGNYYIFFEKELDRIIVDANNAQIYNY